MPDRPDCNPCDDVGVVDVKGEDCCYQVVLNNEATSPTLTGIGLCLIDESAGITITPGAGWNTSVAADGFSAQLDPTSGQLPDGNFDLPVFCLEESEGAFHRVEIKWLSKDNIVCRDTIEVYCEPDCGYLVDEEVICDGEFYVWTGQIVNTSDYPVSSAYIAFDPASGLAGYNTEITFTTALAPNGGSETVSINIGTPAGPGDKVNFRVILHEENDDGLHLNCCEFEACIELPDCEIEKCICDFPFILEVIQGFDLTYVGPGPYDYELSPKGDFKGCDNFEWLVRFKGETTSVGTDQVQAVTLFGPGNYRISMRVNRSVEVGRCVRTSSRNITISPNTTTTATVKVFPNPATDLLYISLSKDTDVPQFVELYDTNGKMVKRLPTPQATDNNDRTLFLNVADLVPGVYFLRGLDAAGGWSERVIVR